MKEFAFGTARQFEELCETLTRIEGGLRFAGRELPDCCSENSADIWFAESEGGFSVYIDGGITTTAENPAFRALLERGEKTFSGPEELAAFFKSLRPLFHQENSAAETTAVVDKEKLRAIQAERQKPNMIWPEQLAKPLKECVFGQDQAIDELSAKVVMNRLRKDKRLLTVVLLGPTATGKSETAKSLAKVMSRAYGATYGYIEIAGSELIGEHTVHRFFGAPPGYVGHGQPTVLEPVRQNPRHVIVINEIEKADEKILVGLMEAIDTGILGMADNSAPIDLNQCVLLLTSNIPIDMEKYNSLSAFDRAELCRNAFTEHCGRPEISGKIGNFIAFQTLSDDAVADIVVKFVLEELDCYDMKLIQIDEYLLADFLRHQTRYGARAIKGLVSDSVGRRLLQERDPATLRGKWVILSGTIDHIEMKFYGERISTYAE